MPTQGNKSKANIVRDEQIAAHIARFADMPDAQFIRAAIAHARYLDKQSLAIAREALRRFDALHPEGKVL